MKEIITAIVKKELVRVLQASTDTFNAIQRGMSIFNTNFEVMDQRMMALENQVEYLSSQLREVPNNSTLH